MRLVAVEVPPLKASPGNAIFAKKQGYKFRRITKEERIEWRLNKKDKVNNIPFISEEKNTNMKLGDPDTPTSEYIKIRNEQDNIK